MEQPVKMVVTDLDGTLLNDTGKIGQPDIDTLICLGGMGIIRVIATGRNLFSAKRVLPAELPIDSLVFSTGAGVVDWPTGELIYSAKLDEAEVSHTARFLADAGLSFMIHDLVPENHSLLYYDSGCGISDFKRRVDIYSDFAAPLDTGKLHSMHASQLLAIAPENEALFEEISKKLAPLRVIRTTSPLDGKTMWIEIFPAGVSKGHTIEWLSGRLSIGRTSILAVGNDYNDLDMLDFAGYSFAVANAPEPVKKLYMACRSNENNGFTDAVNQVVRFGH